MIIEKIIVATNENDILDRFFKSGKYYKENVKSTNSPSMDIQVASNFERLLYDILNEDSDKVLETMKNFELNNKLFIKKVLIKILENFNSFSINQTRTLEVIRDVYKKYNIILDPHTAVGYAASLDYLEYNNDHTVVSLATAHPAKFSKLYLNAIGKNPLLPSKYKNIFELEERYEVLENNYKLVKDFIIKIHCLKGIFFVKRLVVALQSLFSRKRLSGKRVFLRPAKRRDALKWQKLRLSSKSFYLHGSPVGMPLLVLEELYEISKELKLFSKY